MEKLREELAQILEHIESIDTRCEEENREPSETEYKEVQGLHARCAQLQQIIEQKERTEELRSFGDKAATKPEKPAAGETPYVEVSSPALAFSSLGEQLRCVIGAGLSGGRPDKRLEQRASGLNETVGAEGGFLVQKDFETDLTNAAYDTGVLASRVRRTSIGGNNLKVSMIDESSRVDGSRLGGIQAYWDGEAQSITASKPKFRQVEWNLKKLTGLCYLTDELMQDVGALEGFVREWFADEFGFKLDDAILNGNGSGMPLGILNSNAVVEVAKEDGQTATTVVYENVLKMWSRMPRKNRMNAIWAINLDVEPQLGLMQIDAGNGGPAVYTPPGGASAAPYSSLFTRPVIPLEQCATLGTAGDIMLLDPTQYRIVDKGAMQSASSIHVKFVEDELALRFILRADGQPLWNTAITPFKGSNTNSPFISLAVRS